MLNTFSFRFGLYSVIAVGSAQRTMNLHACLLACLLSVVVGIRGPTLPKFVVKPSHVGHKPPAVGSKVAENVVAPNVASTKVKIADSTKNSLNSVSTKAKDADSTKKSFNSNAKDAVFMKKSPKPKGSKPLGNKSSFAKMIPVSGTSPKVTSSLPKLATVHVGSVVPKASRSGDQVGLGPR